MSKNVFFIVATFVSKITVLGAKKVKFRVLN